jgi:3-oxoacyl-[acyl-carrier-protein] synthase-3
VSLVDDITVQKGTFAPITMNGREVYKFAVSRVPDVIEKALFRASLAAADIDWLVLHQANQRILDAVADRLGVPLERVVSNMARHGNTSAASIPLALDEVVRAGKLQPGDIIATAGFGAGLTWGAAILQWG